MENESFFSIKGRLRRKKYLIRLILLAIPAAIMNGLAQYSQDSALSMVAGFVMLFLGIAIAIQAIKRLHDMNMSGWYWLIFLIPVANLIFGLYVIFKDGTPGPNPYGQDPKGRQNLEQVSTA